MLEDLRFRLRALVRRGRVEDDLDDELRFHLERTLEQHVARGLPVREARRRARLAFGPIDAVKDDCRQSWGVRQLDILRRDVACALRLMRKHPALSATAAVSLAIGIGLNRGPVLDGIWGMLQNESYSDIRVFFSRSRQASIQWWRDYAWAETDATGQASDGGNPDVDDGVAR